MSALYASTTILGRLGSNVHQGQLLIRWTHLETTYYAGLIVRNNRKDTYDLSFSENPTMPQDFDLMSPLNSGRH